MGSPFKMIQDLTCGQLAALVIKVGGPEAVHHILAGEVLVKLVVVKHLIDLDADPFVPDGWEVIEHIKGGQFVFDPAKVTLHLDEAQKNNGVIVGNELRLKLKDRQIYNANLLDFYLKNPRLIPEEWKGKAVFFWGTIYRDSDGDLCVRCLVWSGCGWDWDFYWLGFNFRDFGPAAVPASN